MAVSAVVVTLGGSLGEGQYNSSHSYTVPTVASATAFEAALATLVADGASPTQAHVTAVNNAYTTIKAAKLAYDAATAGNLVVLVDTAVLTTSNAVNWAVKRALRALAGLGIVLP